MGVTGSVQVGFSTSYVVQATNYIVHAHNYIPHYQHWIIGGIGSSSKGYTSDHPEAEVGRSTIGGHSSKAPGTAHKSPWSMSQTGP